MTSPLRVMRSPAACLGKRTWSRMIAVMIVFFMVVVLGWSVVVEAGYLVWCDCWKNKCNGNSQYGGPSLRSG